MKDATAHDSDTCDVIEPQPAWEAVAATVPLLTRLLTIQDDEVQQDAAWVLSVDDSPDFAGYRAAGFNLKLGEKQLEKPPDFKPPKAMGMGKWMTYLKNVGSLSPVPKDMKFGEFPEGVKVLGGTYAISNDDVVFSHMDEVPGATPEISAVLKTVGA